MLQIQPINQVKENRCVVMNGVLVEPIKCLLLWSENRTLKTEAIREPNTNLSRHTDFCELVISLLIRGIQMGEMSPYVANLLSCVRLCVHMCIPQFSIFYAVLMA
jgi:hypothetical protein